MPRYLMEKSYVRRDLRELGIEAYTVERPVLVRKAVVLPKKNCFYNVNADDVRAYRAAFRVDPVTPRPGSILYLSRLGVVNEMNQQRSYPSEMTAEIMSELGAKVVLAKDTSLEEYRCLAADAETFVAEHGSAMCNMMLWNPRSVIELVGDNWWNGNFLFIAKAMGVENYAVVRVEGLDRAELRRKLVQHLQSTR